MPFSTASHVSLRLSGGGSASCSLAGLNAGDRKWLACSTRGHVLLEVRSSHAHDEDEEEEDIEVATPHNPYELGLVWLLAQVVSRLLFAPQLAATIAASTSSALAAARHDASLARPAALVAFASASLAALSVQFCGDAIATALAASILLGAAATSPREETARPRLLRALSRVRTASGAVHESNCRGASTRRSAPDSLVDCAQVGRARAAPVESRGRRRVDCGAVHRRVGK